MTDIVYTNENFYETIAADKRENVHLIMIATKPDIIKQIPLYKELQKRGHLVILGHTGQHYDENLSGGMLKEFGVQPDFNLQVRGALHEVVSQIIGRLGTVIATLKDQGKVVIPYVHGDTTTAMAASNAAYCHGFTSVHVEAGIRTLTPNADFLKDLKRQGKFDDAAIARWQEQLRHKYNWQRGSSEPVPEQFNTRCSEAATGIHLAATELDKEFILSEGFNADRVRVVGNSVADATLDALKNATNSTIFTQYPQLANGDFARFCIHRRENCFSNERFVVLFRAMQQLIESGKTVLLISLFQTEAAIDRYNLREDLERLQAEFPGFIYSPVWSKYTDVIAAMSKCAVCVTDSGSMQEEMNVLGVPCVTLRFGSDRSESIMNGGNILAPPINSAFIVAAVHFAWNNAAMRSVPKLYGNTVSEACINAVEEILRNQPMNRTEEQRLGL